MPLASLKGEVLDYWTYLRITMPKRSYERFSSSCAIKAGCIGGEFGFPNKDLLTEDYKKFLEKHKKKFDVRIVKIKLINI